MKVKKKLIKSTWKSFVNTATRFSVKNGQLLKHRITVLCRLQLLAKICVQGITLLCSSSYIVKIGMFLAYELTTTATIKYHSHPLGVPLVRISRP